MSKTLNVDRYRVTKVCLDGYTDKVLEDRIYQYNCEFEEGICFHSTIDFPNRMDRIMKALNFPNYQEYRTLQYTGEILSA